MSVFNGRIIEFPGVIIDRFTVPNCKYGRAFFLSHCHKDHMTGLSSEELVTTLRGRNCNLYCSEVTKAYLQVDDEFKHLAPFLLKVINCLPLVQKSLPTEEPVLMSLPAHMHMKPLQVTITLLPAGHCPGSVMFLLQDDSHSILYTGDFRLQAEDIKHTPSLHPSGRLVELDSLYLDTTFCHPKAAYIPTREESRDVVLQLMEEWLNKSVRHVVHLNLFMVGFEHVILGICEKFGTKVHVSGSKVRCYNEIDAVSDCITADGSKTRVHACVPMKGKRYGSGLPCGAFTTEKEGHPKVMRIKLSAQWFLLQPLVPNTNCIHFPCQNFYRVFHSMHASYNEIRSFVGYLQPRNIIPCVIALNDTRPMDVCSRLKDLLRSDGSIVVNDKSDQSKLQEQHSVNVSPNKEIRSDHTHWASGDDTDSDWASTPVKCHDNRTITRSPLGFTMRKHAGTKRSLFSLDDSSSQEQEATGIVKKSMGDDVEDDDDDSDDHQTSLELSSYGDNSCHGNANPQPCPPVQDLDTSGYSLEKQTILHSSTPLHKGHTYLPVQPSATPTHNVDCTGHEHFSSSPPASVPVKSSLHASQDQNDDVIDLTQSEDEDSDVTYCSTTEDHIYIDSEASLNPTRFDHCTTASCYSNDSPSSLPAAENQCLVLPATPEHSAVRTTSIIMSYHGVL